MVSTIYRSYFGKKKTQSFTSFTSNNAVEVHNSGLDRMNLCVKKDSFSNQIQKKRIFWDLFLLHAVHPKDPHHPQSQVQTKG